MKYGIIYQIRCKINNKVYIGSTKNISLRIEYHLNKLRYNNHYSETLQNDWNLYGEKNFVFETIDSCNINRILLLEQYWINKSKKLYNKNAAIKINNNKIFFSKKTRDKMSKSKIAENNPMTSLTLEFCFKIKEELLKITPEKQLEKYERIAHNFNVSIPTIRNIKGGRHWSSKQLGGSYKDWIS